MNIHDFNDILQQRQAERSRTALEREILWNRHVLATARDPAQRARVKGRLEKMEAQLSALVPASTA